MTQRVGKCEEKNPGYAARGRSLAVAGYEAGQGSVCPGDSLGHCICRKCLTGLSPVGEVAECIGFYKEPWGSGRAEGNLATS